MWDFRLRLNYSYRKLNPGQTDTQDYLCDLRVEILIYGFVMLLLVFSGYYESDIVISHDKIGQKSA